MYSCLWIPAVCPLWPVWAPWCCPNSQWRRISPRHPCCGAGGVNDLRDMHLAWTLCCFELWLRSRALLHCGEEPEEAFSYNLEWTSLLVLNIMRGSRTKHSIITLSHNEKRISGSKTKIRNVSFMLGYAGYWFDLNLILATFATYSISNHKKSWLYKPVS